MFKLYYMVRFVRIVHVTHCELWIHSDCATICWFPLGNHCRFVLEDFLMNVRCVLMATPLTSAGCASDNVESEDAGHCVQNALKLIFWVDLREQTRIFQWVQLWMRCLQNVCNICVQYTWYMHCSECKGCSNVCNELVSCHVVQRNVITVMLACNVMHLMSSHEIWCAVCLHVHLQVCIWCPCVVYVCNVM